MVALTILASTVALALAGAQVGRRDADAALRLQRATDLLAYVITTSPDQLGRQTGHAAGFDWSLEIAPSPIGLGRGSPALCTRTAEVLVDKQRRRLTTTEICPVPPVAAS
jgi:hypothetical protein